MSEHGADRTERSEVDTSGNGSAYRDLREGLVAMRRSVANDRDAVERDLVQLRVRIKELDEQLGAQAPDVLDSLKIAKACYEPWDKMVGNDVERHCGRCKKSVYDVAMMTRAEVNALIAESDQLPCLRLRRRRDGRVVTGDCPTTSRTIAARVAIAVLAGGAALAALAVPVMTTTQGEIALPDDAYAGGEVLGEMAPDPEVTVPVAPTVQIGLVAVHENPDGTREIVRSSETVSVDEAKLRAALGILPTDLVIGINGQRVGPTSDAQQIASKIGAVQRFEVQIERDGRIVTQVYRVTDGPAE